MPIARRHTQAGLPGIVIVVVLVLRRQTIERTPSFVIDGEHQTRTSLLDGLFHL